MRRRTQVIERPRGVGTITGGADLAPAPVRYQLRITQTMHISQAQSGEPETPGAYDVSGSLEVLEGDPMLLMNKSNLVLTLEDGRKVGFFIKKADFRNPRCEIAISDSMTILEGISEA